MTRRTPEQYNWNRLEFDETILPRSWDHAWAPQSSKIVKAIAVHHMASVGKGDGKVLDGIYRTWSTRPASAQYGVDNGLVRQYVWDKDRAFATGNRTANATTISIEHANSSVAPAWKVSDETMRTGAKLAAYLHWVYKLGRPVAGKTLHQHRDYTSTACPGPYLAGSAWKTYVGYAQTEYDRIATGSTAPPVKPPPNVVKHYVVRSGDTLNAIARRFGATVAQLVRWNRIENPNLIDVGDGLIVSESSTSPTRRFSLRGWKWQGPSVENGKMIERRQPQLDSYSDTHIRWVDDVLLLTAPASGFTSPGSKYPRSELREMDGSKHADWSNSDGTHVMTMTAAVTHLPDRKRHVVAAQVHDRSDDVLMVRLEDHRLFVEHDGDEIGVLDVNYQLGQLFTVRVIAHESLFKVIYQSRGATRSVTLKRRASRCYFKAGCYTQATSRVKRSDKSYGTGFGQVAIHDLKVEHS